MNIHHLLLQFKDGEVIGFPADAINAFEIRDKTKQISAFSNETGHKKNVFTMADEVYLVLCKDRPYNDLSKKVYSTVFERISTCDDISRLDVYYSEDIHEVFLTVWNDSHSQYNSFQKSEIIADWLRIQISSKGGE